MRLIFLHGCDDIIANGRTQAFLRFANGTGSDSDVEIKAYGFPIGAVAVHNAKKTLIGHDARLRNPDVAGSPIPKALCLEPYNAFDDKPFRERRPSTRQ